MTDAEHGSNTRRRMPPRTHSNFATRTATDDAGKLNRRSSLRPSPSPSPNEETPLLPAAVNPENAPTYHGSVEQAQERDHGMDNMRDWFSKTFQNLRSKSPGFASHDHEDKHPSTTEIVKPRPGALPRPVGGTGKLGTFAGVFVPTTLNVLSILMFLRFGFILGQSGVVGMMGE